MKKKNNGVQTDIYGNTVHILNAQEVYRLVKCGRCGNSVRSSQAKTHLSFGKILTVCKECLSEIDKK